MINIEPNTMSSHCSTREKALVDITIIILQVRLHRYKKLFLNNTIINVIWLHKQYMQDTLFSYFFIIIIYTLLKNNEFDIYFI